MKKLRPGITMEPAAFEALLASAPAGLRIEIGIARGATLAVMARHVGSTVGVDSFDGMADPGPHDIKDGHNPYPRGRLARPYEELMARFADNPKVRLIQGWVPDVLTELPEGPYAFVHIDLDHYEPTRATIEWAWGRMLSGGIICCDDWIAEKDWLASKAINEQAAIVPFSGTASTARGKAWWIR
jgi:hypothetical protein